jgi:hypothetical protein
MGVSYGCVIWVCLGFRAYVRVLVRKNKVVFDKKLHSSFVITLHLRLNFDLEPHLCVPVCSTDFYG